MTLWFKVNDLSRGQLLVNKIHSDTYIVVKGTIIF